MASEEGSGHEEPAAAAAAARLTPAAISAASEKPQHVEKVVIEGGEMFLSAAAGVLDDVPKPIGVVELVEEDLVVEGSCEKEDAGEGEDPRLSAIFAAIRVVQDFPKPGFLFNDITPVLLDPLVFKGAIEIFVDRYRGKSITAVAGCEARGFIFGPPIALAIGAKFIPLCKPKKLPGDVISETYELEYGTDTLEMHVGAVEVKDRVVIIDDVVVTGGTLSAAIRLVESAGAEVVECACLIGLLKFKGGCCTLEGKPVHILVEVRYS